jgi:hypothetical protein
LTVKKTTRVHFNIFNYTLPFVGFVFDHSLKKIHNLKENIYLMVFKAVLMVYYIGIYVLSLRQSSKSVFFFLA